MKYVIRIADDDGFCGYHGPATATSTCPEWVETQREAARFGTRAAAKAEIRRFGCGVSKKRCIVGGEFCTVVRLRPRSR